MFAFRLALALGYIHPDVMLRQMTARQFAEWIRFAEIDPIGEERADLRMGILASALNNRWRGKNEQPSKPTDYMPYYREPEQSPDEIKRTLRSILGMSNG